jgi:hypothetical protein
MDSKAKSRKKKGEVFEAFDTIVSLDAIVSIALSPTKGKGKRKALDIGLEPRKKLKGLQVEEPVARQELEVRIRARRAIKKTSKVQN